MAWFILPHWPTQSFLPEWDGNKALLVLIWEFSALTARVCHKAGPGRGTWASRHSILLLVCSTLHRNSLDLKSKCQCSKEKSRGAAYSHSSTAEGPVLEEQQCWRHHWKQSLCGTSTPITSDTVKASSLLFNEGCISPIGCIYMEDFLKSHWSEAPPAALLLTLLEQSYTKIWYDQRSQTYPVLSNQRPLLDLSGGKKDRSCSGQEVVNETY